MSTQHRNVLSGVSMALALFTLGVHVAPAQAQPVEPEIKLNQTKALAGSITRGDAPGFPITLNHAGRYVLTSDLYPLADVNGVEIKDYDVTIDFNGFSLRGMGRAKTGIVGSLNTVRIMNGLITGFKGFAIAAAAGSWVVENMLISANGQGMRLGDFARIQRNTITINDGKGVWCGNSCHVEGNVISNNLAEGVLIRSGAVLGNTIFNNKEWGIDCTGITPEGGHEGILGYGNNTLFGNKGGGSGPQVHTYYCFLKPLQPNACVSECY